MVYAVPKDAPSEQDVLLIEGTQSSASDLETECVVTANLAASCSNGSDAKGEADTIQKISRFCYNAVKIVAQPGHITDVPFHFRVVKPEHEKNQKFIPGSRV